MTKKHHASAVDTSPLFPELLDEGSILSLSGAVIDTSGSEWRLSADHTISWKTWNRVSPLIVDATQNLLRDLIQRSSPHYVLNTYKWLAHLRDEGANRAAHRSIGANGLVDFAVYKAFEAGLQETMTPASATYHLSAYERWYAWSADTGQEGFDEEVADQLADIAILDFPTGQAVLSSDPDEGPVNESDFAQVLAKLNAATDDVLFAKPDRSAVGIELSDLALTWLYVCYGANSKNLRYLNEEDLSSTVLSDGRQIFRLRIPRIKKRLHDERVEFRTREVPPDIARLLQMLIASNAACPAKQDRKTQRPMFRLKAPREVLRHTEFERDMWRMPTHWPKLVLKRVSEALNVRLIDGNHLKLYPRRLRYTFAARLVANGASAADVADALDHTDTTHVMVYFNSRGDLVRRLDKTMALALAPVAQAFMGVAVMDGSVAVRGGDPRSRIHHYSPTMQMMADVGTCGSFGFCGLYAPIACYTCRHFQAWLTAPHEQVLDALVAQREERLAAEMHPRMVQINDRTILAVAQVILACEAANADTKVTHVCTAVTNQANGLSAVGR